MIINTNYIDRFIRTKQGYLYPIRRGIYLCFDEESLEYKCIVAYFNAGSTIELEACDVLEKLYSKSILL